MQPDSLVRRVRDLVGPTALPEDGALDLSRPPHVDRAARALLARFHRDNDGAAFALMVEVVQPLLQGGAEEIVRDRGLAVDPADLVAEHLGRLYVDLARPPRLPESFVDEALAAMDADAQSLVDRLARGDLLANGGPALKLAQANTPSERLAASFAALVSRCFHAMSDDDRRLLIALDVDRLPHAEIAERLGIYQDEVATRIVETRGRLAERIAALFASLEPQRRERP